MEKKKNSNSGRTKENRLTNEKVEEIWKRHEDKDYYKESCYNPYCISSLEKPGHITRTSFKYVDYRG